MHVVHQPSADIDREILPLPRPQPHTYRVITLFPFRLDTTFPSEVTFTSHYGLPLPSPKYLRMHAACGRIAYMSGAAQYINKIYRDKNELPVLAEDGSSAPVLGYFLQRLVRMQPPEDV